MEDTKPQVENLGYIGGQDDALGGYCEPLIIRVGGQEHYVMHVMTTYYENFHDPENRTIKAKHQKLEFDNLDELMASFEVVKAKLGINPSLAWEETDASCGYDIPAIQADMRSNLK